MNEKKDELSPAKVCDNIQIIKRDQLEILQFDKSMELMSQSIESSLQRNPKLRELSEPQPGEKVERATGPDFGERLETKDNVSEFKREFMEYIK